MKVEVNVESCKLPASAVMTHKSICTTVVIALLRSKCKWVEKWLGYNLKILCSITKMTKGK